MWGRALGSTSWWSVAAGDLPGPGEMAGVFVSLGAVKRDPLSRPLGVTSLLLMLLPVSLGVARDPPPAAGLREPTLPIRPRPCGREGTHPDHRR